MSRIRTNIITNRMANGAPTVSNGLVVSGVTTTTNLNVTSDVIVGGGLTVGGVLTYEDVTNIDSVGMITARTDITLGDSIIHLGDTNTKMRFPAADTITAETGGSERLRISSAGIGVTGNISVATTGNNQGVSIQATGSNYTSLTGNAARTGADEFLLNIRGLWNDTTVANILLETGSDTTNKDDGVITFRTASAGTPEERLRISSSGIVGIGTNAPSVGKLHIDGDADTDLLMLDTYAAGNYAQVRGSNQSGIRIRGGGSYGGGMIDFGGGLRGTDPGVIKFHAGTDVTASNDEHMRIQANGEIAMTSSGSVAISDALANLHVQNGSFRVSNAAAPSTSHIKITARGDSDDGDYHAVTIVNNNLIEAHINKDGRIWSSNSITAGRTRTDAASPTNYYHNGGHTVAAYSGRTDSSTAYRTLCFIKAWDGGDTGDRNAIYFVDSGSDTTTADYDGHQKFGIKANGQAQFGQALYVGRVESDEGAPDSVYNTGERGVNCYANDATDETYVLARNVADSSFIFYSEVNGEPNVEIEADGSARTDGTWSNTNADYAEMFEWVDGNTSSQERRGMTVVLDGDKIKLATDSDNKDNIIGVVSANPVIVGDSASMGWHGRYKKDAFDAPARKSQEFLVWYKEYHMEDGVKTLSPQPDPTNPKTLNKCSRCKVEDIDKMKAAGVIPDFAIENNIRYTDYGKEIDTGNYDPTKKYIPRMDRKEWDAIGLVGKLVVKRGQPVGSRWILMKSNVGVDPNDNSIVLDKYLVR